MDDVDQLLIYRLSSHFNKYVSPQNIGMQGAHLPSNTFILRQKEDLSSVQMKSVGLKETQFS